MQNKQTVKFIIETILISIVINGINLFFPEDPGYYTIFFIPYICTACILAVYSGKEYGFLSLFTSIFFIAVPMPYLISLIYADIEVTPLYWSQLWTHTPVPLSISLVLVYIFGMVHTSYSIETRKLSERLKEHSQENIRLKSITDALTEVNRELEERVSRQQTSITSLFTQIQKMNTPEIETILNVLLETVILFTKASKVSVWEYRDSSNQLELSAQAGWDQEMLTERTIPIENSIEGWVYRNNSVFSIRMLLQYDNLAKLDTGKNIITLPLNAGKKVWGVLNIRELPFVQYNLFTEKILQIIISLAEAALGKSVEYKALIKKEAIDKETGLPVFSQFYRVLEKEIDNISVQKGRLSVIILEFANFSELLNKYSRTPVIQLEKTIIKTLNVLVNNKAKLFRYKAENQLALIFPNLDFDGAALFCFNFLGETNSFDFSIEGEKTALDLFIGYSAYTGKEDVDELLAQAEHLLEIQKV